MNMVLAADGALEFTGTPVGLAGIRPVINGDVPAGDWRAASEGFVLVLPAGFFHLHCSTEGNRLWLHYRVEGFPAATPLRSFGLRIGRISGHRAFLRHGYFSWDGSYFLQPGDAAATQPVRGHAMTQLLAADAPGGLVVGFDRHDRFQQTFSFDPAGAAVIIETWWDEKDCAGAPDCRGERLVIYAHGDATEEALREWARLIASRSPARPRLGTPRITGWCSWYGLYAAITEENILAHRRGAQVAVTRGELPAGVFQIDDGFTPEMGDWLDVKPQFPRGIKPLLDDIRAGGFRPGLWIAPFMVGNRSRLYREHPDWVVRDRATGGPLAHMRFYAEFRWHKRSEEYYILDTTHPAAFAWLREVFRVWCEEWGCEYFKTDFMHFGSEYGPDRAIWHQSGLTRIEIWRRTAEMIRDVIGDAIWLGCGCPLWASVGLVDGIRIGRDIGVEWKGNYSAESLLRDQATRNFGHGILWQADPDCVLLREKFHHLTDAEVRSLALYAGMTGGVAMTSDALDELTQARRRLWQLVLSAGPGGCRFPRLGCAAPGGTGADPVLVQVRGNAAGTAAVFVFNPTDEVQKRTYSRAELGLPAQVDAWAWPGGESAGCGDVTVSLPPHDSALYLLSPVRPRDEIWRLP